MISFNDNSFTVTVPAVVLPAENWKQTVNELLDMFKCLDPDMTAGKNYQAVYELLGAMMPDMDMVQKMTES